MANVAASAVEEKQFLATVKDRKPRFKEGVLAKFTPPFPNPKPEDSADVKAAHDLKKKAYQDIVNDEFRKFVEGEESDIYLAFQPIWSARTKTLTGLEVLCRVENGKDEAPMPGLATWQATKTDEALKFLMKQCEFAVDACKKLPKIRVSVNVRPDELPGVKEFLIAKAAETNVAETGISNLLIEITEYAPITETTIALIRDMKSNGVVFAIDDVTQVQENPGKAMAKPGTHACSIELAVKHADLFQVQKLSMSMSCSVFRVEVFPTPVWDGGKAQPFLKGMIFPEDQVEEIQTRKELVEKSVADGMQMAKMDSSVAMPQDQIPLEQTSEDSACTIGAQSENKEWAHENSNQVVAKPLQKKRCVVKKTLEVRVLKRRILQLKKNQRYGTAKTSPRLPFEVGLPCHISTPVARASVGFAKRVAMQGVGEQVPAHGFTIIVGDEVELMSRDAEGYPIFGESSMHNIFEGLNICLLNMSDKDLRTVLMTFTQDGAIVIDGRTGKFVAMGYMVGDLRKGINGRGARHKSASAIAPQAGGCLVLKCSEDACKSFKAELDIFFSDCTPLESR